MSAARCAAVLAPSEALAGALESELATCGFEVHSVSSSQVEEAASSSEVEGGFSRLLSTEVDVLITGDSIFPSAGDPDDSIGEGLFRSFVAIKLVLRTMMRRRSGRIITLAPPLSREDLPHHALRSGLHGLTAAVAREIGSRGITANMIVPGYLEQEGRRQSLYMALARWADPLEIGRVVAFVAGESSTYLTGQVLTVDGGLQTTMI